MRKLSFAFLVLLLGCGLGLPTPAAAQDAYPSRPITLMVPYPAGGFIDVVTRTVAEGLREKLKQQIVVLNRPGGNGKIALGELVRAAPDGYTFLFNNDGGIALLPAVDPQFKFDYEKDYTPVAEVAKGKYVVLVRTTLPVNNMRELVDYARKNPGKLTYGSAGLATLPHLAVELLARHTGTSMVHVPYQGAAPALNDLIKGEIDILVNSVPGIMGLIGSDKIKILAAIGDERVAALPDVPTLVQAGQEPIAVGGWLGMFGPPGLPKPVLDTINGALKGVSSDPASTARFKTIGVEPSFQDSNAFPDFYRAEVRRWKAFAQKYGFRIGN